MNRYSWAAWAKRDVEEVFTARSASLAANQMAQARTSENGHPVVVTAWPAAVSFHTTTSLSAPKKLLSSHQSWPALSPNNKPSVALPNGLLSDIPTTFHGFVLLSAEIQIRIIEFAWADLRQWDKVTNAHPCDFELDRMGLACPTVPAFNRFRRSFKSRQLLPLVQKAIFLKSTLLVHVNIARDNYTFLPKGYIPNIVTALEKEPILREHVHELILDVNCLTGPPSRRSRIDALSQTFQYRAAEDATDGPNYLNAKRRREEIDLLTPLITHGFQNRQHLFLKLKLDYMSPADLMMLFRMFSSPDQKFTIEELCTLRSSPRDLDNIISFNQGYAHDSRIAAQEAGQAWMLTKVPTSQVQWQVWAFSEVRQEELFLRKCVWENPRLENVGGRPGRAAASQNVLNPRSNFLLGSRKRPLKLQ